MGRTDEVQFLLECVAAWRSLGARVTFEAGWESRGNGLNGNYEGGIWHHTAFVSSAANPFPARNTLINGRVDLDGPLCNASAPWCAPGDPWLHVIAAFPANHAGASGGRSMGPLPVTSLFNPRVLGLEIDYAGVTPMAPGQYMAGRIFGKGLSLVLGRSIEYVRGHAETSITGKWDPGYARGVTCDMATFRRDAAALTPGGFLMALSDTQQNDLYAKVTDIADALGKGAFPPGIGQLVGTLSRDLAPIERYTLGADGKPVIGADGKPVVVTTAIRQELADVKSLLLGLVASTPDVDEAALAELLRPIVTQAVAAGQAAQNGDEAAAIVDAFIARLAGTAKA